VHIKEIINTLKLSWHNYKQSDNCNQLNTHFKQTFPRDYLFFLKELGEGSYQFKDFIFSSWSAESVVKFNKDYKINHYLGEELVSIATDGGGVCFLLDFREKDKVKFCCVGLGDLDIDEVAVLANSFTEGLQYMIERKITLESLL